MLPTPAKPYRHIVTIARCEVCCRTEAELKGAKMKRCAGCSKAVYCSRECQKEGWSKHKIACRAEWLKIRNGGVIGTPLNAEEPSETVAAITAALNPWKHAHSYALMAVATSVACLNGGWKRHLSESSSRLLVFQIQLLSKERHNLTDGNPAEGFRILSVESWTKETFQQRTRGTTLTDQWDLWRSQSEDLATHFYERTGYRIAGLAGALPALLYIHGSPVVTIIPLPIRRCPPLSCGDPLNAEETAIFEDVKLIAMRAISIGVVLTAPVIPDSERPPPQAGVMFRRKKRDWDWQGLPGFWEWNPSVSPIPPPILVSADELKSGLSIPEIWARFLYGDPADAL